MKQSIILKSLSMVNFKGEKSRVTNFNSDVTSICGANGLGKSRHMDAFLWLLFGKDAKDRQDYEIKTIVNGEPLHKVDCMVKGVLLVDGEEVSLTRKLVEDWVKPKGQTNQVFKGNKTECLWNDAPITITEYKKRVAAIMDDTMFKMLTNPTYFASQKWQLQREHLFRIAGTMTEQEVAESNPSFADLADVLAKKSLADYKAETSASIKLAKKELDEIHPRIDQAYTDMPEEEDYASLEREKETLDEKIAALDSHISAVTASIQADTEKAEEISRLHTELVALESRHMEEYMNKQNELNKDRLLLNGSISLLQTKQKSLSGEIASLTASKSDADVELYNLNEKLKAKRDEWKGAKEMDVNVDTTCPVCGQQLPEDKVAEARSKAVANRKAVLDAINAEGAALKQKALAVAHQIDEYDSKMRSLVEEKSIVDADLLAKQKQLESTPAYHGEKYDKTKAEGWKELNERINALKDGLDATVHAESTTAQESERASLMQQRDTLVARLAKRDEVQRIKNTIRSLEERGVELGETIARLEGIQFHIAEFTKAMISDAESRINALFSLVTFRLFDYTIEGNEYECCIPLIDGIPYGSANTAAQINAGLDIINALCRFYNITAPIFIDNRESVNNLIHTDSQIINLVVTDDKELVVK